MMSIHTTTIPSRFRALAFFFLGTLFYYPVLSQTTNPVLEAALERDILVALYDNTSGDDWTRNSNWKSLEFHYCDWHGITCLSLTDSQRRLDEQQQQQSIESIDLSDNNLQGSVPISLLLLLPNLHTLKLSGNNIDYTKNAEMEESVLGESINVNTPLTSSIHHLDVSQTTVRSMEQLFSTGSGTTTIQTPQLSVLYVNSAQLRGPFPPVLTTLRNLERLSLDHNDLSGTLPSTVGNWRALKYLSIADNLLTGTIPTTTTQWTKLRYLLLEANQLTGSLPLGLTSSEYTPLLEQLDVSDQRSEDTKPSPTAGLSGTIPSFSTQKRLRRLDLGVNSFTGTIPSNFLEATEDLDFVVLSHNLLTGSVPSSVLSRISIDSLLMEDNRITTINPSDCPSADSYGCHAILCPPLFYEPRSGRQEEENRPCLECPENTKYWGQTTCMLEPAPTATITPPPASAPSPGMTEPPSAGEQPVGAPSAVPPPTQTGINERGILLDIFAATDGNEWLNRDGWDSPDTSSDFCNWFGITCVSPQLRSVESIRLGSNFLNGTLPASIYHLPNLKVVDLSRNLKLTVAFENIDRATALEALDVSATKVENLDGLSNAKNMRELRMSDIKGLSGISMPLELFELTELRQLTLDYNNIVGFLPDDIGNLSHLQVFSATDNDLTGSIPASLAELSFLTTFRLTSNHLTGTLPVGMAGMTGLAILDLSNQWSNGEDDDFSDNNRAGIRGPLPSFEGFTQLRRLDLAVNSFSGTIPANFLSGVDRDFIFEYADISENSLTGQVPAAVAGLHDVYMQDNMLTGIDQLVCDSLPGELLPFGCDAVLCAPGSWNSNGRQTSGTQICEPCNVSGGAQFYGSSDCFSDGSPVPPPISPPPSPTPQPVERPGAPTRTPGGPPTADSPTARAALERIYNACGGPSWNSKANWMDENASVCTWWGVRCSSDGRVIGMSLRSNNLVGTFPSKIVFEDIPSLESLILDGNTIEFPFTGIASATSLITLDVSHMELTSVAGVELAPNLKNLYVSNNNLRGNFPSEILRLQSLERVAVAFNGLTGTIPEELSQLKALEFIALHDNEMHGKIPATLGDLRDLAFLLLQGNELHGTIPTQLNLLTKLNFLDLSKQEGQGLNGPLLSFAAVPSLKRIDLSDNSLTGTIPEDFLDSADVAGFDHVDLSFNNFTGELPGVFAKFAVSSYQVTQNRISSLSQELCDQSLGEPVASYGCDAVLCRPGTFNSKGRQLSVDEPCDPCQENQYFGSVRCGDAPVSPPTGPPVEPDFGDAEILEIFYDSLNGDHWTRRDHWKDTSVSVCEWFGVRCAEDGIERVEYLTLSSNKLVGTIPSEIFQLPFLESLVLDSNEIEFSFSGIENAIGLETLDLSSTGLSSIEGVENAKQLKEFYFASNSIVGEFPEELCEMTTLEQLHFDFNSISGPLPECIGQLSNLKLLSCEKNQLTGELPVDMESLSNLVTLRLGRNSFSGEVPSTLNEMTSLAFIDISQQTDRGGPGLFGPIPVFDGLTQLRSLNLKGNSISGSIPDDFLKDVNPDTFELADLRSNAITGTLPPSLMVLDTSVYLQDNKISGISNELCDERRGPLFAAYGCDAVLCPPMTSSPQGRQESDAVACDPCPEAHYFGSTKCSTSSTPGTNPTPSPPTGPIILGPSDPSMERQILVDFYNSCGGDNWDERENWLSSVESICNWEGIVCGGDGSETVTAIEFGANNVVGVPPSELFSLPNLRTLSLYSNPLEDFSFEGIENANSLGELLLDATGISSIKGIGDAPSLTTVNLRFNNLQGSFPSEIAKLTTLHTITMAYNDLTGTLPAFLENLTQLGTLLLSNNHLTGSLHGVNFPSSIRLLDLSENSISGSIPNSFMTLVPFSAELEVDLSNNNLTGSIPTDLTRFDQLNIYLKGNQITGMDQQLCEKTLWNDGDVGNYGCNGLLCPVGFYAPTGRHSDNGACKDCAEATYFGTASCEASSTVRIRTVLSVVGLVAIVTAALFGIDM